MSKARLAEHIKEGLPWLIGASASMLYFADQVHNEGAASASVYEWITAGRDTSKSLLTGMVNPALELMDNMDSEKLRHSDAERFLNKPMRDQVQALVEWFEEEDYERALYYLAIFAKDRGSPHTDWPLNPEISRPGLMKAIHTTHQKGVMSHGLFLASLSAFAAAPDNADALLSQDVVDSAIKALTADADSEVSTVFGLKFLSILAQHQPKTGGLEAMLVKNPNAIPYLLTVLQDDTNTVFEARYPSQLLGCVLRTHPETLRTKMNGAFKDADGNPLTIFNVIKEGCRFKESWAIQYYVRLAMDCLSADEAASAKGFNDVKFSALLVGLLQNNWNYVEVLPPLVKLLRKVNEHAEHPGMLLTYKDFLTIAATVADKAGPFHPPLVQDLYELVDHALHDPIIPPSFMENKRAMLDRFGRCCEHALSKKPNTHVKGAWIEKDQERLRAAVI